MKISLLFFLLNISFFSYSMEQDDFNFRPYAHSIADEAIAPIAKKYGLILTGKGGGLFKEVDHMTRYFDIPAPVSQERVRQIIIELTEGIKYAFQSDDLIQPFLKNGVFDEKNVHVAVFITDGNRVVKKYPELGSVSAAHGEVCFEKWFSDEMGGGLPEEECVPYEEAKRIVEEQRGRPFVNGK